jgi:hypothetical protein
MEVIHIIFSSITKAGVQEEFDAVEQWNSLKIIHQDEGNGTE